MKWDVLSELARCTLRHESSNKEIRQLIEAWAEIVTLCTHPFVQMKITRCRLWRTFPQKVSLPIRGENWNYLLQWYSLSFQMKWRILEIWQLPRTYRCLWWHRRCDMNAVIFNITELNVATFGRSTLVSESTFYKWPMCYVTISHMRICSIQSAG